jgi:hypothetical protein
MYGFLLAQSLSNMAIGIFTLRQQLRGLLSKNWGGPWGTSYAGVFNGTSQSLTTSSSANLTLGTGDFTVEFWMYPTVRQTGDIIDTRVSGDSANSWTIQLDSTNINFTGTGANYLAYPYTLNTWTHVAYTRVSGNIQVFINGVQYGSSVALANNFTATSAKIGVTFNSSFYAGSISNLRIVKGLAVYTGTFAVPVSPLTSTQSAGTNIAAITGTATSLLTLQSATIVDNSSSGITFTNTGSVVTQVASPFNPTIKTPYVEYLVVGGGGGSTSYGGGGGGGGVLTGLLPVTTGTTYTATVGGGGAAGATNNGVDSSISYIIAKGGGYGGGASAGGGTGGSGGGAGGLNTATTSMGGQGVFGQGNAAGMHLADAGATSGYRGGGGGGGAGTIGQDAPILRGGNGGAGIASAISGTVTAYGGGGGGAGYSAGGPVVAGSGGVGGGGAGSDSGTATSGTANTGGGAGGGAAGGTGGAGGSGIVIVSYPDVYAPLTTTGSPTVSTSGSGSTVFNGTTQYLTYAASAAFGFGAGDYTIEAWVYGSFSAAYNCIFDNKVSSAVGVAFYAGQSNNIVVTNNSAPILAVGTIPTNTWAHLAIVRISGTIYAYLNGTLAGSVADSRTYATSVGAYVGTSGGAQIFGGNLSNLRVVKGVGVYTGAFTPSTAPLTATQSAGPSGSNIAAITGTATSLLLGSVSGSYLADSSTNSFTATATGTPTWNQSSPFATGLGYKNRVYSWTTTGSGTFTV